MHLRLVRCSLLVFGSGFCALVYQVAWQRLFRLIFGASTAASAAVVAIFMAGLGLGSAWLGQRSDRKTRPLGFYGRLEAGIAIGALASPLLLMALEPLYFSLGGSIRLGGFAATLVRLAFATLVLAVPTFLMGGTLPAIARAVEHEDDAGRRRVAMLYGVNTLGAVAGALIATFVLLERLGNRASIWLAAVLNLAIAGLALMWSPAMTAESDVSPAKEAAQAERPGDRGGDKGKVKGRAAARPASPQEAVPRVAGLTFVLVAAVLVGFAFFLVELVWYRILSPVLGGSSYTFGLILATALLGIALGGCIYGLGSTNRRPTLAALALTCALEALLLLVPYALGDRVAIMAMLLRPLGNLHFGVLVTLWAMVTTIVVLPASLVAGYQFPLLVGLLGRGRRDVGREIGLAYAANTTGAIIGSLAGGFGLLPLLGATGAWKLAAVLLLVLAAVTLMLAARRPGRSWKLLAAPVAASAVALALFASRGPTAAWRHTPIGAGRAPSDFSGPNDLRDKLNARRRAIVWEADGVESAIALKKVGDFELIINGKSDGSALQDAPTQVMSPMIAAVLHPSPLRALVIGLGTGSSSGWLAEVPGVERVDTVELEPEVRRVADAMAAVNKNVLHHPRVLHFSADGREFLLTSVERYDIILSEPSNPYRAGVSSLFTTEFYAAVGERLAPGGIFAQWLQGYDIDAALVEVVYATLRSSFSHIETWQVGRNDLLLLASNRPLVHDAARVRQRIATSPYREALVNTWGVDGAEGFYTGHVASPAFAASLPTPPRLNTDDRQVIEFGFARNLGRPGLFDAHTLRLQALRAKQNRPAGLEQTIDWALVDELVTVRNARWALQIGPMEPADAELEARVRARQTYSAGNLAPAAALWNTQTRPARAPFDLVMLAETLAENGNPLATEVAEEVRSFSIPMAEAALARFAYRRGDRAGATEHLLRSFAAARQDPWVYLPMFTRTLQLAAAFGKEDTAAGQRLYADLGTPFAAGLSDEVRLVARLDIAGALDFSRLCREALRPFEPDVPWEEHFLAARQVCYQQLGDSTLARRAVDDYEEYKAAAPPRLGSGF